MTNQKLLEEKIANSGKKKGQQDDNRRDANLKSIDFDAFSLHVKCHGDIAQRVNNSEKENE